MGFVRIELVQGLYGFFFFNYCKNFSANSPISCIIIIIHRFDLSQITNPSMVGENINPSHEIIKKTIEIERVPTETRRKCSNAPLYLIILKLLNRTEIQFEIGKTFGCNRTYLIS